ncbi:MAG TPA: F0F1 ATP synthase subunit A [Myxococcaceae bacterium]|nr:F0F1 ATP synthase subunit A [Myxococcaceae bacterium]
MRRWLWCAVLAVSMVARAQEAQPPGHAAGPAHAPGVEVEHQGHEKVDTSTYILEHVADSPEVEFQVPLSDKEFIIHFPVWRIPLKAGACPADSETPASLGAGCLDISLTKHTFWMFVGSAIVVLLFAFGANRNPKQPVPHGPRQNLLEMLVVFVRNEIAIPNIGKAEGPRYTPYLLSVFFFILTLNLLGLVPWASTATGNLGVTLALALCTFVLTQFASIKAAGLGGYLKHMTGGAPWWIWPIMVPVEILGLFTKPFALMLRLFANMLAGHIVLFSLLGLIFIIGHVAVSVVAVPFAIFIYLLELFVAFLQAYIFTMLSALFIGMGVAMGHHDEHAHEEHASEGHQGTHAKPELAVNPASAPG